MSCILSAACPAVMLSVTRVTLPWYSGICSPSCSCPSCAPTQPVRMCSGTTGVPCAQHSHLVKDNMAAQSLPTEARIGSRGTRTSKGAAPKNKTKSRIWVRRCICRLIGTRPSWKQTCSWCFSLWSIHLGHTGSLHPTWEEPLWWLIFADAFQPGGLEERTSWGRRETYLHPVWAAAEA